ncbi:glycosyltransferase [Dyadobacter fermentans]|uniref:Glycosyl transferase group 1 n=1 Tax=Dyadobacter fermentans (strain ATCC 700827 / DSM 18053 / CIP 107007 / KCTC 52180 / NS114) TaxID=471854 RepID=C6VZ18_DYAFD|nr:glycosyltransferase [Dyadobacter fermentans]ACT95224.1 glycosyl transferase group 1 [Dyadobacter fermentans DSM 18053]
MKLNVVVYGVVAGSYRTQNLIRSLFDISEINLFYLNPGLLWERPSLWNKIQRMIVELTVVWRSDIIIIPATRHQNPYKYKLAKFFKKQIITDFYISYYDTFVTDRKTIAKESPEAAKHFKLDRNAILSSDRTIFLNGSEAEYYTRLLDIKLSDIRYSIVPLCVDARQKAANPFANGTTDKLTICWWGSYIPLHGLDKIIEAAHLLSKIMSDFEFVLFGNDDEKAMPFRNKIRELGIENFVKIDNSKSFHNGQLEPFLVSRCDIALGGFGDSEKAKNVFLNKVADAFAFGIPVLSMKTKAMDTLLSGDDIVICDNQPQAIVDAVTALKMDRERLKKIGENGYNRYLDTFSYEAFKSRVKGVIQPQLNGN